MPWWVVTAEHDLMGPYWTEGAAEEVKDGLDVESKARFTAEEKRSKAVQELRHQDVVERGSAEGRKNYKHGGGGWSL